MAPLGIVAAAVASVFALRLQEHNVAGADLLVPLTFATIIGTVALYGLTGPFVAQRLGLADVNPQGVLMVGAHPVAQAIGKALQEKGYRVILVDSNWDNTAAARMDGLEVYTGNVLSEQLLDDLDLGGIGRLLAVTPNTWVNVLAVQRFAHLFGRSNCYQLAPPQQKSEKKAIEKHLQGRTLFSSELTYATMAQRLAGGDIIKATPISEEFDAAAFASMYGESALPMFYIEKDGDLRIVRAEGDYQPQAGHTLLSLVRKPVRTD